MKIIIRCLVFACSVAVLLPAYAEDLKSKYAPIVLPKVPPFSAVYEPGSRPIHGCPQIDPQVIKMMEALQTRISRNWEPGKEIGDKRVAFSFEIKDDCSFSNVVLVRTSGDDQIDFVAREALEEANRFLPRRPVRGGEDMQIQFTFSKDVRARQHTCIAKLLEKYPALQTRKSKILHLIPLDAMQSAEGIDETLVHSSRNLRIVREAYVDSLELQDFRCAWVEFLRTEHITNSSLKDKAKRLERKYSFIFEPLPVK